MEFLVRVFEEGVKKVVVWFLGWSKFRFVFFLVVDWILRHNNITFVQIIYNNS
jgi:hypothetical protein